MKQIKAHKLQDGQLLKRTLKSRTFFRVITKTKVGVVITSTWSNYSAILKNSATVYVKKEEAEDQKFKNTAPYGKDTR